jgi:hypothetical protein
MTATIGEIPEVPNARPRPARAVLPRAPGNLGAGADAGTTDRSA